MAVLERANLPSLDLPREAVEVKALGGAVWVQGMDMPALLRFTSARRSAMQPLPGENDDQAAERATGVLVPLLLSLCVHLDDGPAYSMAQWGSFGAQHPEAALDLFHRAVRMSGQDAAAEKKS